MGQRIEFTVTGTPKAQPRPRAFARGGHARVYNPSTAEGWKGEIALAARPHIPPARLEGPIQLDVDFFLPRPQSLRRVKSPPGNMWHTTKPDVDNALKAVLDCLTTLGFWRDDCQVCISTVRKVYIAKSGTAGALITITKLESAIDSPAAAIEQAVPVPAPGPANEKE